jgi:two-component system chemotaxis response regulator CheY
MKHCLIVDDSEVIRKVARRILEKLNFETSEAEHGQEAIERCKAIMPDAILLDWNMPVMGGIEFLASLRLTAGESERKPYILYCTTENDPVDISKALAEGADDYLLKPFDREAITSKMIEAGLA